MRTTALNDWCFSLYSSSTWQAPTHITRPRDTANSPSIGKALWLWGSASHHCSSLHLHHFKAPLDSYPCLNLGHQILSSSGQSARSSPQRWDPQYPANVDALLLIFTSFLFWSIWDNKLFSFIQQPPLMPLLSAQSCAPHSRWEGCGDKERGANTWHNKTVFVCQELAASTIKE